MDPTDKRELKKFEKELGLYSVAGAICSYGDVIDFVQDLKQGIVLVDTCDHDEAVGKKMTAFLRKEIKEGWGVAGDAADNLEELGRKLAALRDPVIPYLKSDEWFDMISALYVQFDKEKISLSMGGGLGETIALRNDGSLERILMKGGTIDLKYLEGHDPTYFTTLAKDEVMLLQTDGLLGNIHKNIYFSFPEPKRREINYEAFIDYTRAWLVNTIAEKADDPVETIRDTIIEKFSPYFLPKSQRDDDVTFAVIKKK